jgi:phosphoribosylglycinamide formyltransferase-1
MNLGVLASGAGTNLQAILDTVHGRDGIALTAVASDNPEAPALDRARSADIPARVFPATEFADRDTRDGAMASWLMENGVELVVLAGYMQLLGPAFLDRFPQRVINVHPALLPAFPGLDAIGQALDHGVKVFGVTVHYVDEGVDTGRIIAQRAVELPDAATVDDVMAAIRPLEHELLVATVRGFASR